MVQFLIFPALMSLTIEIFTAVCGKSTDGISNTPENFTFSAWASWRRRAWRISRTAAAAC